MRLYEETVFGMNVCNPYLFHYFLREIHCQLTPYLFKPAFSGGQLGRKKAYP